MIIQFEKINLISCFKSCIRIERLFCDLNANHIQYQYPAKGSGDVQNKKQKQPTSLLKTFRVPCHDDFSNFSRFVFLVPGTI